MEATTSRQRLGPLLEQEYSLAEAFLDCLSRERSTLVSRDWEGLNAAVAEKQRHIAALETTARERAQVVIACGYNPDQQGIADCLGWCDPAGALQQRWEGLLEIAGQCRDANLVNGGITALARRHAQDALRLLRGQATSHVGVYGPRGQSADAPEWRSLARV